MRSSSFMPGGPPIWLVCGPPPLVSVLPTLRDAEVFCSRSVMIEKDLKTGTWPSLDVYPKDIQVLHGIFLRPQHKIATHVAHELPFPDGCLYVMSQTHHVWLCGVYDKQSKTIAGPPWATGLTFRLPPEVLEQSWQYAHFGSFLSTQGALKAPVADDAEDDNTCHLCMDNIYSVRFFPCGHAVCNICIVMVGHNCDTCRTPIESLHRIQDPGDRQRYTPWQGANPPEQYNLVGSIAWDNIGWTRWAGIPLDRCSAPSEAECKRLTNQLFASTGIGGTADSMPMIYREVRCRAVAAWLAGYFRDSPLNMEGIFTRIRSRLLARDIYRHGCRHLSRIRASVSALRKTGLQRALLRSDATWDVPTRGTALRKSTPPRP